MEIGFPAKTVIVLLLIKERSYDMGRHTIHMYIKLNSRSIFAEVIFTNYFFNPIKFDSRLLLLQLKESFSIMNFLTVSTLTGIMYPLHIL